MTIRFTKNPALVVASLLLLAVFQVPGQACSWAIGYFYQVTELKGRVVGAHSRYFPWWLRQSFARKHTKLTLYEYRWPRAGNILPIVKAVETDDRGMFDFGPVNTGHYTLVIGDRDSFDVELKANPTRRTETLLIDVSPVFPDCTGGHELIVKTE